MPILHEPDPPQPPIIQLSQQNVNAIAVAVLLALTGIVGGVWAVDDHFISRREFNLHMRTVTSQLHAINARLGIVGPPPPRPLADSSDDDGGQ